MTDNSTKRIQKLRAARKAAGQVRREYYATPKEHDAIKEFLAKLRSKNKGR